MSDSAEKDAAPRCECGKCMTSGDRLRAEIRRTTAALRGSVIPPEKKEES